MRPILFFITLLFLVMSCGGTETGNPSQQNRQENCDSETYACPGTGTIVTRNPNNNCEFDPCP